MNTQVITAIMNGEADDDLHAISRAVNERIKLRRAQAAALNKVTLTEGKHVRTVNLRPKYLSGLTGTVVPGGTPTRLRVKMDDGQYLGKFSRTLNVPASALEEVA